ncbi:hypothetical protein [Bacillus cereus]|uniref:hypothetical protein n=1 Tax=Bacillus cereus TaxID=1396 RepID=UPI00187A16B6|nr:hypothetical protein [Bacillus cereus]MBE7123133.1 hypothetical protein [Bacillus cereus]
MIKGNNTNGLSDEVKIELDQQLEELKKLFNVTITFKGYPKKYEDINKEIIIKHNKLNGINQESIRGCISSIYEMKAEKDDNLPILEDMAKDLRDKLIGDYYEIVKQIAENFCAEKLVLLSGDLDFQLILDEFQPVLIKSKDLKEKADEEMRNINEVRDEVLVDKIVALIQNYIFNNIEVIKFSIEIYIAILLNSLKYTFDTDLMSKFKGAAPVIEVW